MIRPLLLPALALTLGLTGCNKSDETRTPKGTDGEPNEPPPAPPLPDDGLQREVESPTEAMARSAASAVLGPELAVLSHIVSVGPTRFAAAWRVADPEIAHAATAHLVLYGHSDDEGWTALSHTPVLSMDTPWLEEDQPPPMFATVMADDYDDDGRDEVLIRIEEQIMCPGAGPNTITHLHLFNQGDDLTRMHTSELHHRNENGIATEGKAEHVDLNDDGHRDLRITYTTRDEHDGSKRVERNTWLWDRESDELVAQQVEYKASGCDW